MRLVARWGMAVAGAVAGFAVAWWVCGTLIGLDEGVSLGVAGAVLAVLLAVAAWWASREPGSGDADGAGREQSGSVKNTISGGTFSGPVLQGRDFTGLTFGASPAAPASRPEDLDEG